MHATCNKRLACAPRLHSSSKEKSIAQQEIDGTNQSTPMRESGVPAQKARHNATSNLCRMEKAQKQLLK
jgi:hypothetical protein